MSYNKYLLNLIYHSIIGYHCISLDPESQTNINVIIMPDGALVSSLNIGLFKLLTHEELVNDFCGMLTVNHIESTYYSEGDFIRNRSYSIDDMINEPATQEDYFVTPCFLKFATLCKALSCEAKKTGQIFGINLFYSEDFVEVYSCDNQKSLLDSSEVHSELEDYVNSNEFKISLSFAKKLLEVK